MGILNAPAKAGAFLRSNGLDLDGIGIAAATGDGAAGDDDIAALIEIQDFLGLHLGKVHHNIHVGVLVGQDGGDAPAHGQTAPDLVVGGHAHDVHGGAEAGDQHGGLAGDGADDHGLGVHVQSHVADGVGDLVQIVLAVELGVAELLLVVVVLLGVLGDLGHGAHGLDGVLTGGRLAGDNVGNYYYYEEGCEVNLPTGATDVNATATNIFNNKNAANYGNASDTYAEAGWVSVAHTNGLGLAKILLPGSVVEMLNASAFVEDKTSANVKFDVDTSWYTGAENKTIVYELYDAADLLGFSALGNEGITFKSVIVKLMANIDLNPGWDATTVVNGKEVTLAEAPANVWDSITTFEGVFDGNSKTIRGIYSYNTPSIPNSGVLAVGGFIDRVVRGEIKDLIVLNSLSVTAPTTSFGSTRLNAGGFIGHCEDATLTTLYVDMDAWIKFDYHCNFGGMISAMGTSESAYAGTVEDIVFAGTVGAISSTSNDYTTTGKRTTKYRFGGMIAASIDWMGTKDIKLAIKNVAFVGALYWPGNASGDDVICYTGGGTYNVGFGVDNVGNYYYYESGGTADLPTGATDVNAVATNIFNNKNAANYGNANDTYAEAGWVSVEHANGIGLKTILLPGSVGDMFNAAVTNFFYQLNDDGRKIRFVAVIDLAEEELPDYSKVGFDFVMSYEGKSYDFSLSSSTVYSSILADGVPTPASEFGGTYFFVAEITNLDMAVSDIKFSVSGFLVPEGGEAQFIFENKVVDISANPEMSLPEMAGTFPTYVDTGDNCRMINYGITGEAKYEAYCADMEESGFTLYAENKKEESSVPSLRNAS